MWGTRFSALSLFGRLTDLVATQPITSGSKVAIREISNGAFYGADFIGNVASTSVGGFALDGLGDAALAKLGFDAISYGTAVYNCYQVQ